MRAKQRFAQLTPLSIYPTVQVRPRMGKLDAPTTSELLVFFVLLLLGLPLLPLAWIAIILFGLKRAVCRDDSIKSIAKDTGQVLLLAIGGPFLALFFILFQFAMQIRPSLLLGAVGRHHEARGIAMANLKAAFCQDGSIDTSPWAWNPKSDFLIYTQAQLTILSEGRSLLLTSQQRQPTTLCHILGRMRPVMPNDREKYSV
jgi:hypothetical protein